MEKREVESKIFDNTKENPSKKILVIDDDPEMTRIVSEILSPHHYEVIVAHDGVSAIEKSNQERVDLILLDIRMPLLSGFWFAEAFRQKPQTKGIPVIVMSALAGEEEVQKAYQLGVRAYLKKPFNSATLLDVIQKALA